MTVQRSGPPVETQKTDKSIYLLLALTTALWGSLYTANKFLLEAVPSFTLLCLRYLLSAAAKTAFQCFRKPDPQGKPRHIRGSDWKYVVLFGLGGYVLSIGLQQYGTKLAGASLASLINFADSQKDSKADIPQNACISSKNYMRYTAAAWRPGLLHYET